MTLTLHTRGIFTWREWADALAAELAAAPLTASQRANIS